MRTPPDKQIIFNFHSLPSKDKSRKWKASIVFAPGSSDESSAAVRVEDGTGEPIAEGTLEISGLYLKVLNGVSTVNCGEFVHGRHEPAVWLHRKGRASSPGVLTFE